MTDPPCPGYSIAPVHKLTRFKGLDLTLQWGLAEDDVAVGTAVESLLTQAIQYAKSIGKHNEFLYLNYALPNQDPIAGYGEENVERLRATSRHYDPKQVFQNLVPGGFKLHRKDKICCG